jgi:hypothetical protein
VTEKTNKTSVLADITPTEDQKTNQETKKKSGFSSSRKTFLPCWVKPFLRMKRTGTIGKQSLVTVNNGGAYAKGAIATAGFMIPSVNSSFAKNFG